MTRRTRRAPGRALLALLGMLIAVIVATIPVSAHANLVRAEPGISASVPTAPTAVHLYFSETPEPRYSEIEVFNTAYERFDLGDLHVAPNDAASLIVGVRALPQGIYTVIWKTTSAVDGHTTGGSFAFGVGAASVTGGAVAQSTVIFSTPKPLEVETKWLAYLSVSVFLGAIALGLFIWTPALAAAASHLEADETVAEAVNQRLGTLAEGALFALIGATALGALVQVSKATGRSLIGVLNITILHGYLFETRTGSIWALRLFLTFLAALVLGPRSLRIVRAAGSRETNLQLVAILLGLAVGVNELLTISLISHSAATPFWTAGTVAIDWLHLLATAVWIGGLVGLVVTVPIVARRTSGGRALLRAVVGRFSDLALVCVGVLVLTGLYSAWVHVGTLGALGTTDYGRALLIKLALVLGLILLGAFNILWVRPWLAGTARAGIAVFRRSVSTEVVLGAAVLLVVAVLTGLAPSREAQTQTGSTNLTQQARAGDMMVSLTPSTLQPGVIIYAVYVAKGGPVRDAARVTLRFASPELGADETEAVTTAGSDGQYIVTGPYTTLPGNWQTRVIVRRTGRDDVEAAFTLPIGGTAVPSPLGNTARPAVTPGTILVAWLVVFLVAAALGVAAFVSRRLIARSAFAGRNETHLTASRPGS